MAPMVSAVPRLDPNSRRNLAGFALRACVLSVAAASPGLLGLQPLGESVIALQAAYAIGALFAVARAARRGDRLARGSLNAWDEAAAFWGGMLLHAVSAASPSPPARSKSPLDQYRSIGAGTHARRPQRRRVFRSVASDHRPGWRGSASWLTAIASWSKPERRCASATERLASALPRCRRPIVS
jgi:hypothetical protein